MAQAKSDCVVFGMPKEAIRRGAVEKVVPLEDMAQTALDLVTEGKNRGSRKG